MSATHEWRWRAWLAAAFLVIASGSAPAQNNTGYPSGTKCVDLVEPRRSACTDAFDPRPNPREVINKPPSAAVTPPPLRPLNQDASPTDPRVPHTLPPPFITKQHQ